MSSGRSKNGVARLEADSSSHACASGRVGCLAAHSHLELRAETSTDFVGRRPQSASRCSIPCFETLASVMVFGIQSGLSAGASSFHAQPS